MSWHGNYPLVRLRKSWACFLAALGAALLLSCGPPAPKNPFDSSAGTKVGGAANRHRVRFEVSCRGCLISWRAGMDAETVRSGRERRPWSHAVTVYTDLGETVATLSATPDQTAGVVSWVRIRVNGEVAAEARNDEDTGVPDQRSRRTLFVETPIPPSKTTGKD